ncbi:hypothetical protein BD626DRAFT_494763 [Schizophyllum amplum]|uniref:PX domain-containing protein n=1 Tax=Schizophyllum amplum TaxID=97359 RepID=A0A550CFM2_9AGAR|nr:hypothetical protein BD626DRAFT_494763 [Auriculariopsis ampla]
MATLPRATKSPNTTPVSSRIIGRPVSEFDNSNNPEFDAGLNTSTAWTEHLEHGYTSDPGSGEEGEEKPSRPARALYDFEGKAEFRELTVYAGDELQIVREELPDGWSLVRTDSGEVGLLPRTYYTFTSDFTTAPDVSVSPSRFRSKRREASDHDRTPRGSPTSEHPPALPIIPQHTGEWFPSFKQSLLGGKSLNRFSAFVTSGAEEWVLKGSEVEAIAQPHHAQFPSDASDDGMDDGASSRLSMLGLGEADRHYVDAGPAWKAKLPAFRVLVHSPSKRASVLSGAFTMYNVTSLFDGTRRQPSDESEEEEDNEEASPTSTRMTVSRRFSHFVILHTALSRRLPGIALPPLPEKQYAGRFSDDFVEARRGDLERYINKIVRHPIARYAEILTFFLGCESDLEWKRLVNQHLSIPPAGPSFYARVFHPAYNVDAEDAAEAGERFDTHTRAAGKGVQALRNIFGRVREARLEMSKAERLLSYSLLSLITSKPLASAPTTGVTEEDEQYNAKGKGLMNADGAWCWRECCEECLKLTKAMQKTSDTMQNIADMYDGHARRAQLETHEALKGVAHPYSHYEGVIQTHRSALSRYHLATAEGQANDDVAARCETVLNTTMAEMDTYHQQKVEDFGSLAKDHLDGEIKFYEQVLHKLKNARQAYDEPEYNELAATPRQPSMYERELENPRLGADPLTQPCPHVYDSAPMRPVSVALQEGVGLFLGPAGRGSMLGKLWPT